MINFRGMDQSSNRVRLTRENSLINPDEILVDSVSVLTSGSDYFERQLERPLGKLLPVLAAACIGLGYLFLLGNAWVIQLYFGERFFGESEKNRFVVRPAFPPRGLFYDTRGEVVVENVPSFGVIFNKEVFAKAAGGKSLKTLMRDVADVLGRDESSFFEAGIDREYALRRMSSRVFLAHNITREEIVALAARGDALPGIEIIEGYRRVYRDPFAYAHLLGFVGKIGEVVLRARAELRGEDSVGKAGIEAQYDMIVRGTGGKRIIEVDSRGADSHVRFSTEPKEGAGLRLAIDGALQETIYSLLKNYTSARHGASAVALDPRDGAVRALVSFPGFDATRLGSAMPPKEFEAILKNPLKPFFNRAISGEFPAGSTMKPVIAAAALE